jgi:hypothetical protein
VPLFEGVFGDPTKPQPFSASGDSSPFDLRFSEKHGVLHLKGLLIDEIRILSIANLGKPYACGCIALPSESYEGFRSFHHGLGGPSVDEVFCRTALAGQDMDGNRLAGPGLGSDCELLAVFGISSDILKFTDLFREHSKSECNAYNRFLKGRQLFVSQNGYAGLGPREACVGDKIGIFPGGSVPYLLQVSWVPEHDSTNLLGAIDEEVFHVFIGKW